MFRFFLRGLGYVLLSLVSLGVASSTPIPAHAQAACLDWDVNMNPQDSRVKAIMILTGSGSNCRGAIRLENGTGLPLIGGGYTLDMQTRNVQNATVQWTPMGYLLPSLAIELHAIPVVVSSPAQVDIRGNITLGSLTWDASLFLLRTILALDPIGIACWVPEEQLVLSAIRVSSIVATTADLASSGDWVGARQEFSQVADEFYTRAGESLKDAGIACALEPLKKRGKTPILVAKVGLAFLTWMPVAIFDYFVYQGRPIEIKLEYKMGSALEFAFTADMGNNVRRIYGLRKAQPGELPVLLTPTINAWHPALSKGGKWVAFESEVNGVVQIFLMDAAGKNIRRLTSGSKNSFQPAFSPDGQQIIFASEREGDTQIFVMNTDGSNQRKLVAMPSWNFAPEYSLSSNFITFVSYRDGNAEIYIANANGTNQRRLTNSGAEEEKPCFMPGDQIIFHSKRSGHLEIYSMNRDGSNVQQLTHHADGKDNFQVACSTKRLIAYAHIAGTMPHIIIRDLDTGNEWFVPNVGAQGELGPAWQR